MTGLFRTHGGNVSVGGIVAWRSAVGDWRGRVVALRQGGTARVELFKPMAGTWRPDGTTLDLPLDVLRPFVNARVACQPGIIEAKGRDNDTELALYGDIGPGGITAVDVASALRGRDDSGRLAVYLSSPGGSPFEGIAIGSIIARWRGRSTVYIDGLAASAATLIAVSSAATIMSPDASYMIHRAWTGAIGDRDELQHTLEVLDHVDRVMAGMYASKTGMAVDDLLERMAGEWWLDAPAAKKFKFVDAIASPPQRAPGGTTAMMDRPWFARCPRALAPAVPRGLPVPPERLAPDAGSSTPVPDGAGLQRSASASASSAAPAAPPAGPPAAPGETSHEPTP
jgi:ATP-dependent protease ClpP protease subunit